MTRGEPSQDDVAAIIVNIGTKPGPRYNDQREKSREMEGREPWKN